MAIGGATPAPFRTGWPVAILHALARLLRASRTEVGGQIGFGADQPAKVDELIDAKIAGVDPGIVAVIVGINSYGMRRALVTRAHADPPIVRIRKASARPSHQGYCHGPEPSSTTSLRMPSMLSPGIREAAPIQTTPA